MQEVINFVFPALTGAFFSLIFILVIWELIWKGIALWKCGRNNQLTWFVFILVFNTAGILPIIYILFFQKKKQKIEKLVRGRRKNKS